MLTEAEIARFWQSVTKAAADECWLWNGTKNHGYGVFQVSRRRLRAHRVSLELDGRPAPSETSFACHTCDNPPCVNPAHLWWGSSQDNALDCLEKGRHHQASKTHCPKGHAYSGDNVRITVNRHGHKNRTCVACANEGNSKYWYRRKNRLLIQGLFETIRHGSEAHQAWLKEAIACHFDGTPVPPVPVPETEAVLPCDVRLPPATTLCAGVSMSTLLSAIEFRREQGIVHFKDVEPRLKTPAPQEGGGR